MPPPAPTRTRLDQLIDLLAPATFTRQQYLNALRQNEQDVQRAAEWLLLADVDVVVDGALKKKTSGRGLKEWLKSSANTAVPRRRITVNGSTECITLDTSDDSDDDEADLEILHASTSPPTKGNLPPLNPPTATKKRKLLSGASFMAHLTSNNHSTPPLPTRKPGERPLHLRSTFSSPSETTITYTHLPTLTLHRSPLPPALASALFLQLMRETDSFERHEWFLAGRYVTSPHTSRYYHSEGLERDDEVAAKQAGLESDAGKDGKQQGNQYWYAGKQVQPAPVSRPFILHKKHQH
ncbi:hypothetical protein QFC24_005915 [Naganishia onofrii]|uniref:Uncharacterized protein n=1 Tax=Naganishia onofrii TaxID=1851511 RepID=A0ACC2X6F9_9TREE|nr:hypothetical protein QFC24_005915 [Naganishia onofrii]